MTLLNSSPGAWYDAPATPLELAGRIGVDPKTIIKLDANENPYGPPPGVLRALYSVEANRYPDPACSALRSRLSQHIGFEPDRFVLGNGSDELIDLICRLVLRAGDKVVNSPPTFGMYAVGARAAGAVVVDVPRRGPVFALDLPSLEAAARGGAKIVFVCSPNNPTCGAVSEAGLRKVLAAGPLVVVDEAYTEYAGRSFSHLAAEYSNLVVLRTFSKAFGLAGLRIGYGIFPLEMASAMSAVKAPYNVSSAAQAAALAALDDVEWVERHVAIVCAERDRQIAAMRMLPGLEPLPTETNFLLVRSVVKPASELFTALLERGIMVRWFQRPPLNDYLRITTGTPEQNDALLAALREILEKSK